MNPKRWAPVLAAIVLAGCARPLPPPGGPPDTTPPRVTAVSPESLAVDVPVDAPLVITFSEKVDNTSFERALWVTPGGVVKPRIRFKGETVTVELGVPFPEETTVGVLLTTVIKDRKRQTQQNELAAPYRWIFATGDSLWPGRLAGKVEKVGRSGNSAQGQLLVGLYGGDADTVPDPAFTEPVAITQTDPDGNYLLDGLPVDGRLRWLFALYDRDGNHEIAGTGEYASAIPDSVVLDPAHPEATIPLRLVDPNAPAEVSGTFARAEGDSVDLWVEFHPAEEDTLTRAAARGQVGADGTFALRNVAPGSYLVAVFCDLDGDGRRGDDEPVEVFPEPVTILPGEKHDLGEWTAPSCPPPPEPADDTAP